MIRILSLHLLLFFGAARSSLAQGSGGNGRMCGRTLDACPEGCWHASGLVYADGSRICVPAGPGYYSPAADSFRHACDAGTFSNTNTAPMCTTCPAGTYSPGFGAAACTVCSSGTYSDTPGAVSCSQCDVSEHYDGDGANSAVIVDGRPYCRVSTSAPTMAPTTTSSPTSSENPSAAPTSYFSLAPSSEPSAELSFSNESFPLLDEDVETEGCQAGTFFLHGACAACPGRFKAVFVPLSMLGFVLTLLLYLLEVAPCCTAILFIGVEYLQLLVLLGIIHVPWTKAIENFYWILSVFALDVDAAVPLQCYLGLSSQSNHILVLTMPVLFYMMPLLFFQVHQARGKISRAIAKLKMRRVKNWLAIGLFFGCAKLLLTSFEAISCSSLQDESHSDTPIDWFCISSGDIRGASGALIGIAGFLAYGVAYPWWVIHNLSITHHGDFIKEYPEGEVPAPRYTNHWTRLFLRPFERQAWWWAGFLLGRKCILVVVIFLLQDAPFLTLTFVMVLLVLSEIIQQRKRPFAHDDDDDDADDEEQIEEDEEDISPDEETTASRTTRRHIWRLSTVDLVLHCCLVFGITLGLIFLALPEAKAARVALTALFFVVTVPSLIYLILAACCCICRDCRHPSHSYDERDMKDQVWNTPKCHGDETCKNSPEIFVLTGNVTIVGLDNKSEGKAMPRSLSMSPCHGSADERDIMAETWCEYDGTGSSISRHEEIKTDGGSFGSRGYDDTMEGWQQPTSTFDESWVPTHHQSKKLKVSTRRHRRHRSHRKNHESVNDPAANQPAITNRSSIDHICDSEDEHGNYIFADDESIQSNGMARRTRGDDHTEASSLWTDEFSGFPTVDRSPEAWGDTKLVFPMTSSSTPTCTTATTSSSRKMASHSEEEEEETKSTKSAYRPSPSRNASTISRLDSAALGRTMVLQPCHRVEPATWGKRQSAVYQPQVLVEKQHHRK